MKKRILALILALLLSATLLPVATLAAGEEKVIPCGDFVVTLKEFLRTEEFDRQTVYVVVDNSEIVVEAAPGKSYWVGGDHEDPDAIAGASMIAELQYWDCQRGEFFYSLGWQADLQGPEHLTIEPNDAEDTVLGLHDIIGIIVAESDALRMAQGAMGGDFSIFEGALYHYNGTSTDVVIPDQAWQIFDNAFYDTDRLTSISLPGDIYDLYFLESLEDKGLTDIYYRGGKGQWERKTQNRDYEWLEHVNVHVQRALPATQTVLVDGKPAELQAYALADSNGNLTNYVKARDVAMLLNGTNAQFEVGWNQEQQAVDLAPGKPYTPNGSEMSTPFSGEQDYDVFLGETTYKGWYPMSLNAIQITDANGGGYTYYKLRDLGQALHFNVGWAADKGVYIETDKSYDPAN